MAEWIPDTYALRARLLPAFIVVWPPALAASLWFEDLAAVWGTAVVFPALIAPLASQLGRDSGREKQDALWQSWGGAPTTQWLRHRNPAVNPILRQRCVAKLSALDSSLQFPTIQEEEADPASADHRHEAAVRTLIERTRGDKLVFKENVSYGFRRNLWAMKPVALLLALISLAVSVAPFWLFPATSFPVTAANLSPVAMNAVLAVLWLFRFTPSWVRIAADAYCHALFGALERQSP